jgi:hypothetical protein
MDMEKTMGEQQTAKALTSTEMVAHISIHF